MRWVILLPVVMVVGVTNMDTSKIFGNLMSDPAFQIGLGMMGSTSPGGGFGQTLSKGILQGMTNVTAFQQADTMRQVRKQQIADSQAAAQAEMRKQAALRQWVMSLPPDKQQAAMGDPETAYKQAMETRFQGPTAAQRNYDAWQTLRQTPDYQNATPAERELMDKRFMSGGGTSVNVNTGMAGNLPKGWHPVQLEDGRVVAQPYVNTPDWRKQQQERLILDNAYDSVSEFKKTLSDLPKEGRVQGYLNRVLPNTDLNKRLSGRWAELIMQLKEMYKLGALQEGEVELMEKMVTDPTNITTWNLDSLESQLDMVARRLEFSRSLFSDVDKALGKTPGLGTPKTLGQSVDSALESPAAPAAPAADPNDPWSAVDAAFAAVGGKRVE